MMIMELSLPTLKYRRLRGGMIEVFRIINQKYDCAVAARLTFNPSSVTKRN